MILLWSRSQGREKATPDEDGRHVDSKEQGPGVGRISVSPGPANGQSYASIQGRRKGHPRAYDLDPRWDAYARGWERAWNKAFDVDHRRTIGSVDLVYADSVPFNGQDLTGC